MAGEHMFKQAPFTFIFLTSISITYYVENNWTNIWHTSFDFVAHVFNSRMHNMFFYQLMMMVVVEIW